MGIPLKIEPKNLNDYLEVIAKAVFQAGLSWAAIDKRWNAFAKALRDFDPHAIANLSDKQMNELQQDPALLINDRKIKAMIHNAKALLSLEAEYGGIQKYFDSFET